jgi:hypothetical protein
VPEGDSLSFTLQALDGYEVVGVSTSTGAVLSPSGGVYTLPAVHEFTTVFVDTKALWQPADLILYTTDDLIAFRDAVNAGDTFANKIVRLGNDIDLTGAAWDTRIGNGGTYGNYRQFSGTFDGDGYSITVNGYGLFQRVSGAVIKNLTIDGAITLSGAAIALQGYGSAFVNCTNNATMTDALESIGIVNNCYVHSDYASLPEPFVGVFSCLNTGDVIKTNGVASGFAAGIALQAQRIVLSTNTGNITGGNATSNQYAYTFGSVIGANAFIDRCVNTGNFITNNYEDGAAMMGKIITNSYNTGDVRFDGTGVGNIVNR